MRSFLLNTLYFIILLLSITAIVEYRLRKNINNHYERQYSDAANNTKHANAIIIGASHATNGIRPSILDSLNNLTFYNFSLGGTSPKFYYNWYTNIFSAYYQKPQYCIYAIDWTMFDKARKWRHYEQDSEFFPFSVFINNLLHPWQYNIKTLLLNRFCLIKYNTRDHFKYIFEEKTDYSPYLINGYDNGFIPYELDKATRERKFGKPDYNCIVSLEMQDYFEKLIALLRENNINIIFVDPPEYGGSKEIYENMPAYHLLNKLSEKYSIPFLSYNIDRRSFINDKQNYFTDWDHLNSEGSILFSKMLKEDLRSVIIH